MDRDEFWKFIDLLGARTAPAGFERLSETLKRGGTEKIFGFADQLARVLAELDRPGLARQPFRDSEDPDGPALTFSADAFLYARCAAVVAGSGVVEDILTTPAHFGRPWDLGAEALLEVAPSAYERLTGQDWEHEPVDEPPPSSFPQKAASSSLADSWLVEVTTALDDRLLLADPPINHPERVEDLVVEQVSTQLSDLLRSSPGFSAEIDMVQILLLLSDAWDLVPRSNAPHNSDDQRNRSVQVRVRAIDELSWSAAEQDRAVLGIAAHTLRQVLEPAHLNSAVATALGDLTQAARDLIPLSR
jgi:Protein of unknown function (DUF4240)